MNDGLGTDWCAHFVKGCGIAGGLRIVAEDLADGVATEGERLAGFAGRKGGAAGAEGERLDDGPGGVHQFEAPRAGGGTRASLKSGLNGDLCGGRGCLGVRFRSELANRGESEKGGNGERREQKAADGHSNFSAAPATQLSGVNAETWADTLGDFILTFEKCVENWQLLYKELVAAWEQVPASDSWENRRQADVIHYQLQTLYRLTVIEALADARFLPRYGFPIGLSRLRVQVPDGNNRVREEDQFRLQRDSMMALGEYAPGSQLLVGGKIVTSRGLLKHWTGALIKDEAWGLRGRFKKSNDFFDYSLDKLPPCDPPGSTIREEYVLLPKHGFTTAAWDAPRFGSDFERVGKLEKFTLAFNKPVECDAPQTGFGGISGLVVTYRNGGELFLLNSGAEKAGFAICQKCGFAESEWKRGGNGRIDLPKGFERHAPLNSAHQNNRCWDKDEKPPVWRNHHLAAKQSTHLLRFDFSGVGAQLDGDVLYTVGQALRIAAAKVLELDEREIGIIPPVPDSQTRQYSSVILYDSLAGGSGHLAELSHPENAQKAEEWLSAARELLTVDGKMPDAVRKREATRRLLTADCDDGKLDPERALSLLRI